MARFFLELKLLSSIIIPVFKNEKQMIRILDQLKKQTSKLFEVILVSDGCDQCFRAAIDILMSYPFMIQVYNTEITDNFAVAAARNLGAKMANGEQFIFLDPDVLIPKDMVSKFQEKHEYGYLILMAIDYVNPKKYSEVIRAEQRIGFNNPNAPASGFLTQCSAVDRTSFMMIGGFDIRLIGFGGSDTDFGLRHYRLFQKVKYIKDTRCRHIGLSSGLKMSSPWDFSEVKRRIREKWYDDPANWIVFFSTNPAVR
jgi:glycosyltransferase involved in cell wall biosynthesis